MDIFQNNTKTVPMSDAQIVRVSMEQSEIGGRKDNLPSQSPKCDDMNIKHVPSQG